MRTTPVDRLGIALFGKAKRAILSRLLGSPDKRFFVRELARAVQLTPSTLTRDLASLAEAGVIVRSEEGRQVYYQANRDSPVYAELRGLVTKTFGIAGAIRAMLDPVAARIAVAAIYGSVAKGEHAADSDIDLLIIGDVTSSEFANELSNAERALARSISPTVYPLEEFRAGAKRNPFIKAILDKPLVFIIGDRHELKRVREG